MVSFGSMGRYEVELRSGVGSVRRDGSETGKQDQWGDKEVGIGCGQWGQRGDMEVEMRCGINGERWKWKWTVG